MYTSRDSLMMLPDADNLKRFGWEDKVRLATDVAPTSFSLIIDMEGRRHN